MNSLEINNHLPSNFDGQLATASALPMGKPIPTKPLANWRVHTLKPDWIPSGPIFPNVGKRYEPGDSPDPLHLAISSAAVDPNPFTIFLCPPQNHLSTMALSPSTTPMTTSIGSWITQVLLVRTATMISGSQSQLSIQNIGTNLSGYQLHQNAEEEWMQLGFLEISDFGFNL
ncbi:hypothetical protein AAC387_Pa04g1802 [Persea americana]